MEQLYEGGEWVWKFSVPESAVAEVSLPGEKTVEYPAGDWTFRRKRF